MIHYVIVFHETRMVRNTFTSYPFYKNIPGEAIPALPGEWELILSTLTFDQALVSLKKEGYIDLNFVNTRSKIVPSLNGWTVDEFVLNNGGQLTGFFFNLDGLFQRQVVYRLEGI